MTKRSPFRDFKMSPEIIRLAVMLYVRFLLSLKNVEDLLHERGIDVSPEIIRLSGTGLACCSQLKSAEIGSGGCAYTRICSGI